MAFLDTLVEPTPARQDRRGAWRHGLAGSGETHSRSPQSYAALRRLSAWTERMSIFFKTVRSASVSLITRVIQGPAPPRFGNLNAGTTLAGVRVTVQVQHG